jgi:hypothetical protein
MRFALIAQHALADAECPIERQMCHCRSAFVPLGSSEIGTLILSNVTAIILLLADVICAASHRANLRPSWAAMERYLNSLNLSMCFSFFYFQF